MQPADRTGLIPCKPVLTTLSLPLYDSSNRTSDSTDCCMTVCCSNTLWGAPTNTSAAFTSQRVGSRHGLKKIHGSQLSAVHQLDFETGSGQIDSSSRSSSQACGPGADRRRCCSAALLRYIISAGSCSLTNDIIMLGNILDYAVHWLLLE